MDGNLAIYAAHLPLDVHPAYGNNALLAKACGLRPCSHDGLDYHGVSLGTHGEFQVHARNWSKNWKPSSARPCRPSGKIPRRLRPEMSSSVPEAREMILPRQRPSAPYLRDREGSHWNIPLAQELGVNLVFGGHYFTETFA